MLITHPLINNPSWPALQIKPPWPRPHRPALAQVVRVCPGPTPPPSAPPPPDSASPPYAGLYWNYAKLLIRETRGGSQPSENSPKQRQNHAKLTKSTLFATICNGGGDAEHTQWYAIGHIFQAEAVPSRTRGHAHRPPSARQPAETTADTQQREAKVATPKQNQRKGKSHDR